MKVKVVFGSDIRRWHAPEANRYEALIGFVQNTFNFPDVGNFFLQFEDDEGDRMTLSSANDLNDAFTIAEQEGRKSLKIFLIPVSIQEARQDALSQFGSARSVSGSLDQFEVLSNPQSHADSSISGSVEVPEVPEMVEASPQPAVEEERCRTWQEELTDFLGNEAVNALLPDFVRGVMQLLRQEESFDVALLQTSSRVQFEAIDQHPFFEKHLKPHLDVISLRATQLVPVLLAFDDDHVASIVPQLIETAAQMLCGVRDCELDVTPIFATLFPTWMAMMNANNPQGGTVDLTHIFGCGNAEEAAASMMAGSERKEENCVHENITCDMCNRGPIRGIRYKCCVCSDFDMCGDCEATNTHNHEHPLLKLRRPCRGFSRPRMHGLREMFGRGRCGGWRKFGPPAFGPPPHPHGPPPYMGHHGHHGHHGHQGPPPPHHGPFHHHGRPHGHGHQNGPFGRWGSFGGMTQTPAEDATSVCSDATVRTEGGRKLKASFVEDANLPDRSSYRPGLVLEKTWRMKNTGPSEWGDACSLVFVKGCRPMTMEERYPVPNAQPGEVVEVSAMIRTPDAPNRYCAYYRLERDGSKFGPRVWVDIFVTNNEEELGETVLSKREAKQMRRQDKLQRKQEKLAARQEKVRAELDELNEQIVAAQQPEGPSLSCMCGAKLMKLHHKKAYAANARINCDICGRLARKADQIFHCPVEFSPVHPEGYDLCEGCGQDQLKLAAKQIEEVAVEMKQEAPPDVVAVEEQHVQEQNPTEMNPTAPPEPVFVPTDSQPAVESGFPFQDGLMTVMQMGFGDEEHVKYLLMEYKGNVEAVVQHLLSSA